MMTLRLVFIVQALVMLTGFAVFLTIPANLRTMSLLLFLVALGAGSALYAMWQFAKHPARRKLAGATILTPVLCLTTPFLAVGLNGNPVSPVILALIALVIGVISAFAVLSSKTRWQTEGTFATRSFNIKLGITQLILLILFWIPITVWLNSQDVLTLPLNIEGSDRFLRSVMFYFVSVAGPAFLMSLFTLFYAPVGVVRNKGSRVIHIGQLALSLLTLASLAIAAVVVAISLLNPG